MIGKFIFGDNNYLEKLKHKILAQPINKESIRFSLQEYKKEKRRPLPGSNRNIPPAHRPGPKRPPGRPQLVHHGQMGRPPERKVSPGGYAIRRYPQRQV